MSDPNYSSVSLLLHCDGSDNSTTFTDSSPSPQTVTANGNAKLKTVAGGGHVKFGTAAGYFDGSGDYLSLGSSVPTALQLGGGDFTIEFWVYTLGTSTYSIVGNLNDVNGNGHYWVILNSTYTGLHTVQFGIQGAVYKFGSSALTSSAWYHIALSRSGTNLRCFIDGTQLGTTQTLNNFTGTTSSPYLIGISYHSINGYTSYPLNGYLDDLRITKGTARYTGTFTAPTAAFPDGSYEIIAPSGIASATALGSPAIHRYVALTGFAGTPAFGTPFFTEPNIDLVGFAGTPAFGTFTLFESLSYLHLSGFAETPAFGALRLYEFLRPAGFAGAPSFGTPRLVPSIRFNAFSGAALFGAPDFAPPPIAKNWLRTRYQCTLTGAADGETDLLLPMSSFAIRLNPSTASSFVQVVIPGVDSYADAIAARPNGSILITRIYDYLDGSYLTYEMARADFDSLRTDTGGQSGSTGTMQGYYTLTSSTARSYDLSNPTYRSWDGETVRYRCELNPLIRPGDTVTINDETLELRSIQHNVDVTLCLSEISGVLV